MLNMAITLYSSNNEFINYPQRGVLETVEIGTDGSVIQGAFRQLKSDGSLTCLVSVIHPIFTAGLGIPSQIGELHRHGES